MTDTSSEFIGDASVNNTEMRRAQQYHQALGAWQNRFSEQDAMNLTMLLQRNPQMTAETAAAITVAGLNADDPLIRDIAAKDAVQADKFGPWQWAKAYVTRPAGMLFESAWEHGPPSLGRTFTRMAQGENPVEAWKHANTSYLAESARQHALGNPIEIGDGIFPHSTELKDRPGYYTDFKSAFDETGDINSSLETASQAALDKYGTVLTSDVHDIANSTLVNKVHDGVAYSVPYSAGRALMIQTTTPDTLAFQVGSALVDGTMRVGLDPSNPYFFELTKGMIARNAIMENLDTAVANRVRVLRRERHGISNMPQPDDVTNVAETYRVKPGETRDVRMFDDALDDEWARVQERAAKDPDQPLYKDRADPSVKDRFGEEMYDEINPYSQHDPDLTVGDFVDEVNRQGGRRAYEDFVLEHELVHADESRKLIDQGDIARRDFLEDELESASRFFDRANESMARTQRTAEKAGRKVVYSDDQLKFWDEAEARFLTAQAEFHEFVTPIIRQMEGKAEGLAWTRFVDPEYTMQAVGIRSKLYREAGIRYRWRPWLKPSEAADWLVSNKAKPVLNWLSKETRVAQIQKRLPMLPFSAKQALGRAATETEVARILEPYLGLNVSKTPHLGTARLMDHITFNPMSPVKGHATHDFSSSLFQTPLERTILFGRRMNAQSAPIILSPYKPNQSLDSALQWLKTIRATDDEIEEVIRMIGTATGSHSYQGIVDVYQHMVTKIMQGKLVGRTVDGKKVGLGYSELDYKNVLTQMGHDHVSHRAYMINNATNPVHRIDDGMRHIAGLPEGEMVPRFSAVLESQFSDSWIGMPNLRDTRRATSKFRAMRENRAYGFGRNGAYWGNQSLEATRLGLSPGRMLHSADVVHNIWRNWMLLRFGWPIRVVGEEMLRAHAYGYGQWFSHPIDVLAQVGNTQAKVSLMGDSLKEIMRLDGLGAGGWKAGDQVYDMSRATWTTATPGQLGYNPGLTSELLQLRGSRIGKLVAEHGVDKTYDMILANDNVGEVLRELLEAIGRKAPKDSTMGKLAEAAVLRRHLESVDAMLHQSGGGFWIERTQDARTIGQGTSRVHYNVWRDMDERPLMVFYEKTKGELYDMARRYGIASPSSMNKRELANAVSRAVRGHDDIPFLPENRQFFVVEQGHQDVRSLVSTGEWGGKKAIWDDMTVAEVHALEGRITDMYGEVGASLPKVVRTAVKTSRDEQRMATVVDRMFELLMQKPSTALARSPHFVTRYTEEVARMYLTADPRRRALIEGWVIQNGFERPWQRAMRKMMDRLRLKDVPGGQLDAVALEKGNVAFVKNVMGDDMVPPAGMGLDDVSLANRPLDDFIEIADDAAIPEGYAPSSGYDLRNADLDDLIVTMVDTEMQAEMLEQGIQRFERGMYWAEGAGAQGDITDDMFIREFHRRLRTGEITSEELFDAAQRIETLTRNGEDVGQTMDWMWGPMDMFDDAGMLSFGGLSTQEEAIETILRAQGIEYQPGDFYFHGSYTTPDNFTAAGGGLDTGGLVADPAYAYSFVEKSQYGKRGYLYVFRRNDFPENVSQYPRVERAMAREYYDELADPVTGEANIKWDTTIYDDYVEPVAVIDLNDIDNLDPAVAAPGKLPQTELDEMIDSYLEFNQMSGTATRRQQGMLDEIDEIISRHPEFKMYGETDLDRIRARYADRYFDEFSEEAQLYLEFEAPWQDLETGVRGVGFSRDGVDLHGSHFWNIGENVNASEMMLLESWQTLRQDLVEQLTRGATTTDEIEEAIGRAVLRNDYTNQSILDDLTDLNTELSGIYDDVPKSPTAGGTGEGLPFAQVPDAAGAGVGPGHVATKKTPAAGPSPWSNRAIGVLTEDQQLLQQIDDIAKAAALQDTKDLFYDLTRRANFTDMARYIFPFGDAFLEQMRIWIRAMTPYGEQTGQALQNWRRAQIGVTNARKSGFFSEDEYGNEVMNWPGAGRLTHAAIGGMPADTGMSATIRPDQLAMMNLTPRGMIFPGTHGMFIQLPAASVQHNLQRIPQLRDMINWFAFGEYGPSSTSSIDGLLDTVGSTTLRRVADAFFSERRRTVYADEINLAIESLIESGDPYYGDDKARQDRTIDQGQRLGSVMAFLRIADGIFSPAQPRYEPEMLIDVAGEDPFWMDIAALADEFRQVRTLYEEKYPGQGDKLAIDYMRKRFDLDALTLVGNTREVVARPVTKDAFDEAQTHRELYDQMSRSMMMWLPHDELDLFYLPAHQKALREDDRQRLTAAQAMGLRQRQKGYLALEAIARVYETMTAKIHHDHNGDHRTPGWSEAMNDLNRWRDYQRNDVYAMYPPVEPHAEIEGLKSHPSFHDTLYEVIDVGTVGTEQNDMIRQWQPDMARWAEAFAAEWRKLEQISMVQADAHTKDWWLTSNSETADWLRQTSGVKFNQMMMEAIASAGTPERAEQLKTQIGWFMERVVEPLFNGHSINDEMFLVLQPTPAHLLGETRSQESLVSVEGQ